MGTYIYTCFCRYYNLIGNGMNLYLFLTGSYSSCLNDGTLPHRSYMTYPHNSHSHNLDNYSLHQKRSRLFHLTLSLFISADYLHYSSLHHSHLSLGSPIYLLYPHYPFGYLTPETHLTRSSYLLYLYLIGLTLLPLSLIHI